MTWSKGKQEMVPVIQPEHENYRVIVLSPDGKNILVVPDGNQFALPSVKVPRWQRVAENLTEAVKTDWGEEVVCLFELDDLTGTGIAGIHYQAAEHWCSVGVPMIPTRWIPVERLSKESLASADEYFTIQRSRVQCSEGGNTSLMGPFAALGWFKELRTWIDGVLAPLGFRLNGNFRQLNASPTFSLIRFETDGPALWFKAVGEPNQREFPVTCVLSRLFPSHVPAVVATRPDWNAWLMREAVGPLLSEVQGEALWEKAAAALAQLQIESIGHGAQILGAGARDVGVTALSRMVEPFIETMARLMEQQTKVPPEPLHRTQLRVVGDRIQTALEALEVLGIPETLGHLDLNPGNIIVSPEQCVFLDWAEAYIGNPFFTFEYLLEHLRRTLGVDSAVEKRLVSTYCSRWEAVVSGTAIDEVLTLTPLLAVFAYAAGSEVWRDEERMQDPATAGYLRSLARRMYREANSLSERRSVCLH
ncbi:MAG: phosphotransferase [Acidobacteria bacterium]|nr:phosphotransferase [Acidobacteriota bacterium]